MSQTSTDNAPARPHRHLIALGLAGVGLFLLGAVVGTVSLHFWIAAHDFRRAVSTTAFIQDWQLNCPPQTRSGTGCSVRQTIVQRATNTAIAQLEINRGVSADMIRVVVPLGVLLGPGLAIAANGGKALAIPYITCDTAGCIAMAPLPASQLDQMEKGGSGQIAVVGRTGKTVGLPYSLKGFAEAMRERDEDWRRRSGHWF